MPAKTAARRRHLHDPMALGRKQRADRISAARNKCTRIPRIASTAVRESQFDAARQHKVSPIFDITRRVVT
jgi:hypothetical protein